MNIYTINFQKFITHRKRQQSRDYRGLQNLFIYSPLLLTFQRNPPQILSKLEYTSMLPLLKKRHENNVLLKAIKF